MTIRHLTGAEFRATITPPMQDVTTSGDADLDIWPYVELVPVAELEGHSIDDVKIVYRSGDGRFEHVLISTGTKNVFLVLVVDLANKSIAGHHLLDLNREYGLTDAIAPPT